MEGTPSRVSAPLEEGILAGGPNVDEIGEGSPSEVVVTSLPPPRPTNTVSSRRRPSDQVLLSTYIPPYERFHPLTSMVSPNLESAQEIIHHWSPFNQVEPSVAHMNDLYSNYFRIPVADRVEQYSIPFLVYMNKEAFQLVGIGWDVHLQP